MTIADIERAHEKIRGRISHTPLLRSSYLGAFFGGDLFLKCDNLQKTGSFKVRGVLNKLDTIKAEAAGRGVVTISAGNHAQAVAWAATASGISSTVVMPASAPVSKVEASKGYGAQVILEADVFSAFSLAQEIARKEGKIFIHPFEDELIIAGHGTAGLEILTGLPATTVIVCGIGGGALCSGIAVAAAHHASKVKVFGVEPIGAASMRKSLDKGEPVKLDKVETIADGLGAPMAGQLTYQLISKYVEDVVLVTDREIAAAMAVILTRAKLLAEPAGAAAVAAVMAGKVPLRKGDKAVCVISGGNVDAARFFELISGK